MFHVYPEFKSLYYNIVTDVIRFSLSQDFVNRLCFSQDFVHRPAIRKFIRGEHMIGSPENRMGPEQMSRVKARNAYASQRVPKTRRLLRFLERISLQTFLLGWIPCSRVSRSISSTTSVQTSGPAKTCKYWKATRQAEQFSGHNFWRASCVCEHLVCVSGACGKRKIMVIFYHSYHSWVCWELALDACKCIREADSDASLAATMLHPPLATNLLQARSLSAPCKAMQVLASGVLVVSDMHRKFRKD